MEHNQIKKFANNLHELVNSTPAEKTQQIISKYLELFDREISVKVFEEYNRIVNDNLSLRFLKSKNKCKNFVNCLSKLEILTVTDIKKEWSSWSNALIGSIEKDFNEYIENVDSSKSNSIENEVSEKKV